ncbi:P-loop containing nucleoside triphosphate hydrolase protein [Obelidium mucronatum]|nr:P-loop containing nucleoside triphosphate hydrolase protein [Obelidium mucronatum]
MNLFSALGFRPNTTKDPVSVLGLDDLVAAVEDLYKHDIESHKEAIAGGNIEFDGLAELYVPGSMVVATTGLAGGSVKAGYRVRESWFEEKKTLFSMEKCFKIRLESVVSFGTYFAVVEFEEVYSGWTGAKIKSLQDLGVVLPSGDSDYTTQFQKRGAKCIELTQGTKFVEYRAASFFVHGSQRKAIVPTSGSGRVVIDCERGLLLGHYPSQGSDEITLAIQNAASRYKRVLGESAFNKDPNAPPPSAGGTLLLYRELPEFLFPFIWPAVVGFSFAVKAWGHVLIDSLQEIQFNDQAFDQLVLNPARKKLIKALVRFGGKSTESKFHDIVSGKSGGSVFLLHGPPGCGKTLTAEAISELLHKPLYYVTMGELGTNPEEMEKRLGSVLDLCSGWDALAIIDEADVFLEKRASASSGGGSDVVRNAMVCVMLRLLEYHQGILFLTTNRVLEFDPALESRVTVALRYDHLDPSAREQIWRNLIGKLTGIQVSADIDYAKLAQSVLNGRQIKNAVRLALALAEDEDSALTQALIEQTMAITSIGREEMVSNAYSL